jgi:imidazolonepropionase-like amidohydrolase
VPSDLPELGLLVTSPDDAAAKVHRLLDDGADLVKIALERGSIWQTEIPVLSPEEAAGIVAVAHERGTVVSAHVTAAEDLPLSLDAGVDDIAHMVGLPRREELDPELIERMVENDVYWIPTLELWRIAGSLYTNPAIAHLTSFVEAGGQVALGTDYAGYRDEGQFDLGMPITEMELMQQAGMTPRRSSWRQPGMVRTCATWITSWARSRPAESPMCSLCPVTLWRTSTTSRIPAS